MKLMGKMFEPRPKAEHQLKTPSNLQIHLVAPFSINTTWFGLQNISMSIPEDHRPLSVDIILHLQNSKCLAHQETIFRKGKTGEKTLKYPPIYY